MTYSRETWKLLLTKTSAVLDDALIMVAHVVSNMSLTVMGPSVTPVLDVLGELRLDLISDMLWKDISFISALFGDGLRPFLSSASGSLLQCVSGKNLTCQTFQHIVSEFSHQFDHMREEQAEEVLKFFILPFLSRNSSDSGCISNNSMAWLLNNYGRFSVLVPLKSLFDLNKDFDPLAVLDLLSSKQTAELMVLPLPHPQGKDEVINRVLDHLLESPVERNLPEVLYHVVFLSTQLEPPCEFYQAIIPRLRESLTSVPGDLEPIISGAVAGLLVLTPTDCEVLLPITPPTQCPTTPVNESRICEDINSNALQSYLAAGLVPCNISLEQYACAQLTGFTAQHLAQLLVCKLSSNMTYSRETWKLLLTKTSAVLDDALIMVAHVVSNMSLTVMGPSVTPVLDVLGELRLDLISDMLWKDISFISALFGDGLRPFLSSASGSLLQCVSGKNLTCQTFQHIVSEFSHQFDHMREEQAEEVLRFFILPFLSRNSSDSGCISNNSMAWLLGNYGRFSVFVPLKSLFDLNKDFDPLAVLDLLSPKQTAELMVLPLPHPQGKDEVINRVLDHLLESPVERNLPEVLYHVVVLSRQLEPPCEFYQAIIPRLRESLTSVPGDLEPIISGAVAGLLVLTPTDCEVLLPITPPTQCPTTPVNESRICEDINSNALQSYLAAGLVPCNISLNQYACAQLTGFTAQHLAQLLVCNLSSNMTYSRETWKLLLTKTSAVLDDALIMVAHVVSNMSLTVMGPSVTPVLDVLGELRLDLISDMLWKDISFISALFGDGLRPFLSSASGSLLQCVSGKNLTCQTFQHIVSEFSHQFDHMREEQAEKVLRFFILPFLSRNSSDSGCISNNSMAWLLNNYGRFSVLVPLKSLFDLNKDFDPLAVLDLLSPKQTAELMVLPLPHPQGKDEVINRVLDHLLESPMERNLPEVLYHVVVLSRQLEPPCEFYQAIIPRLRESLTSVSGDLEIIIRGGVERLLQLTPIDCLVPLPVTLPTQCLTTPVNESRICEDINSNALQSYLAAGLVPCNISLEQYACAQLTGFTAQHLAQLLVCKLSSNMTYSRETWKLLLTKTSAVLDDALIMVAHVVSNKV
ncbi:uncharacterized protein LOC116219044 [Clupea harengus]|uniref:Uncharacterized protein LOC116219044 n=1 Tax=Clupea harengus TaxID=7950 RepID=A0A6P8EZG7_CLUHA|nr:uncharacterized protein LOC116219044 [Clupea harengus]